MTTSTTDRIRVRAYFHFENRTGKKWADPVSNWLQAEEEEHSDQFFEELGRRVDFIRSLYRRYRIPLKPREGFTVALDEAEALAKGIKSRVLLRGGSETDGAFCPCDLRPWGQPFGLRECRPRSAQSSGKPYDRND